MYGVFWVFNLSKQALCDHIIRSSKRSWPLLRNDSVYGRGGNISFKQRFCRPRLHTYHWWRTM